jgi:hypothetical protein
MCEGLEAFICVDAGIMQYNVRGLGVGNLFQNELIDEGKETEYEMS